MLSILCGNLKTLLMNIIELLSLKSKLSNLYLSIILLLFLS